MIWRLFALLAAWKRSRWAATQTYVSPRVVMELKTRGYRWE